MQNVLVIGGTGYIGSHIVDKLLDDGYQVLCLSRQPPKESNHPKLNYSYCDIERVSLAELSPLLSGMNALVFAAGVDERQTPKGDAYNFFAKTNIAPMRKALLAAKKQQLSAFIVINSVFSYLDRTQPDLALYDKHPYIRSRVDQRDIALANADDNLNVAVFEIPYVFGGKEGQASQWERLIDYLRLTQPLFLTKGGANMINVRSIANACSAAINRKFKSGAYPIGDTNMTWQQLFEKFLIAMGSKQKRYLEVPHDTFDNLSKLGGFFKSMLRIQSGLDNKYISDLVTMEIFFEATESQQSLGFTCESLNSAFIETIKMNPEKSKIESFISITKP